MSSTPKTKTFEPLNDQSVFDNLIKYAIAPRPICFASTIDAAGNINLSPFSYFNLMSHQPPICVFSPLRRMRDGTTKHTLDNMKEVGEVVINVVNYAMVQQQSLASTEYGKGINEFHKSGLTPVASTLVKPPRVAESPVQLECRVRDIIALSDDPGAGNLVLAEVLRMHVHEHLLDANQQIAQEDLDLVARLGGDWYCRADKNSLFVVPKPLRTMGIGVDRLPAAIRLSHVLTGNHLGLLANVEQIPELGEMAEIDAQARSIDRAWKETPSLALEQAHRYAARLLDEGNVAKAWQVLLLGQ